MGSDQAHVNRSCQCFAPCSHSSLSPPTAELSCPRWGLSCRENSSRTPEKMGENLSEPTWEQHFTNRARIQQIIISPLFTLDRVSWHVVVYMDTTRKSPEEQPISATWHQAVPVSGIHPLEFNFFFSAIASFLIPLLLLFCDYTL